MTEVFVKDDGGDTARMVDMGDYIVPRFHEHDVPTLRKIFDGMPTFSMRDDDIMLCSFPKTGSNWLYEILAMMLNKSTARAEISKYGTMMDAQIPEDIDKLPSPRIMNSHYNLRFLAEDLQKKQIKTVLILRNPKDTAVSYYNHIHGVTIYGYHGEWKNWMVPFMKGNMEYGKYADYLREWHDVIEKGVGFPLHVMYYEDLKMNGVEEIDKLEKFLDLDLGAELKEDTIKACHFDKMLQEKVLPKDIADIVFKKGFQFYRKGQIGDWKNWFTVRQNEVFDEIWAKDAQ